MMKVIMYGTETCPDCVAAKAKLTEFADIALEFKDITNSTATLKEFLHHRDHDEIFAPVIARGGIGIPFFVLENNTTTLELEDLLGTPTLDNSACAADGKGC